MIKKFKRWYWTKYYTWVFRKYDRNICCCGGYVDRCGYGCGASAVPQVDWSIHCAVAHKMGEKP